MVLAFVEAFPLLVNEQVFGGVQVRAGLSFRAPHKMGETWLLSCAAWTIYISSYFRVFGNGIWNAVNPLLEELVPGMEVCYLF